MLGLRGTKLYDNAILLGAGCKYGEIEKPDYISMKMYNKHLSKTFIHSVRDDTAKRMMENRGLKVINTRCPTLWMLTKDFCHNIPKGKSKSVVFALTSENKNPEVDIELVKIIRRNYEKTYFWIQRLEDELYLQELTKDFGEFELIYKLVDYESILKKDVDYVGTRLHGGIYALQHSRRAIILSIDHRANGMTKENNIPCIPRDELSDLDKRINSSFSTEIQLNIDGIEEFKSQFDDFCRN